MDITDVDCAWLIRGIGALPIEELMDLYSAEGIGLLGKLIRNPKDKIEITEAISGSGSPSRMEDLLFFYSDQGLVTINETHVYLTDRGQLFTDSQILPADDFVEKYFRLPVNSN